MSLDARPRLGLLTALRLVTNGAFRFLYPFLPVVARDLGLPTERAGLLIAAIALGGMATPVTRRLVTGGHERDRMLVLRAGLLLVLGLAVAAAAPTALLAMIGFALLGTAKPLTDIAAVSYVSARSTWQRRARATATMELTWAGGLLVVAPIAGVLAGRSNWRVPLLLLGGGVLVALAAASRLLERDAVTRETPRPLRQPFGATGRRFLVVVWLLFAALETTFAAYGIWLDDAYGVTIEQLGLFAALSAIGELIGSGGVALFGDRVGKIRSARVGLAITAVGALAIGLSTSLGLGVAAMGLALLGSETAIVASIPLASEVQPRARTRFLAAMVSSGSASRALAAALAPAIYATFGIRGNAALTALAAVLAAVMLGRTVRRDPRLAD